MQSILCLREIERSTGLSAAPDSFALAAELDIVRW